MQNLPGQAEIAHLSLFDLEFHLKACSDEPYRRDMFLYAEATANVLTDEHLTNINLRTRYLADGEKFKVLLGDLTSEGFAFARKGYQRWLTKTDRWKTKRTLEKLESALRKEVSEDRRKKVLGNL